MRNITIIFVAALLISLTAWAQHAPRNFFGVSAIQYTHPVQPKAATTTVSGDSRGYEVAFIPRGLGGVHYRGDAPGNERAPQGPAALVVDGMGGFWVLDTVVGHVLHLDSKGNLIADLDLSKDLVHGAALSSQRIGRSQEERIAVYDLGVKAPRVIEYDQSGTQMVLVNLPLDWMGSLQKIFLNADGSFDAFLVAGNNFGRYRVSEDRGQIAYAKVSDSKPFSYWGVESDPTAKWLDHIRTVDPDNVAAEKEYLGQSANGDRFFRVGEFAGDAEGNMYVDVTIQRFRQDGSFSGMARVPVREQYIPVESNDGIAFDASTGSIYVLVPRPSGASIRQLKLVEHLEPLPPIVRPATSTSVGRAATYSIGTGTMIKTSNSYCNAGTVWVPASAVPNDSTTTGRTSPSLWYMSTSGGYYGVPYSFGGFDTLANFATHMSQATAANHYKAGDVDTTQQIFTTGMEASQWTGQPYFGVDCSGFVSRCWGLQTKEGTTSLLNYVSPNFPTTLQQGDIMDKSGTHVRMYVDSATSPSSSAYYIYAESYGDPYGPWIHTYRISDQVSQGYVQYRYGGAAWTGYYPSVTSCPR
jgi:hypothetical protein